MSSIAVIGDVHGCLEELDELLFELRDHVPRRLVFLGDLLDRGPDGAGVVHRVRALGAETVQGNHDERHVRWRKHEKVRAATGKKNPMDPYPTSDLAAHDKLTDDDIAWLGALPLSLELGGGWVAVHAGLEPCKTFDAQRDCPGLLRTRYIHPDGRAMALPKGALKPAVPAWFWAERWFGPEGVRPGGGRPAFLSLDSSKLLTTVTAVLSSLLSDALTDAARSFRDSKGDAMFEVHVFIPVRGNDGKTFTPGHHGTFEAYVLVRFSGISKMPGRVVGQWIGEGVRYVDALIVYVIAVKSITEGHLVGEVVAFAKIHYRQEAIYLRYLGVSEIV